MAAQSSPPSGVLGTGVVRDLEDEPHRLSEVEADLLVPVTSELMRTSLGQEAHLGETVGCLQLLESGAKPTGYQRAKFPGHPVARRAKPRELGVSERQLHSQIITLCTYLVQAVQLCQLQAYIPIWYSSPSTQDKAWSRHLTDSKQRSPWSAPHGEYPERADEPRDQRIVGAGLLPRADRRGSALGPLRTRSDRLA